MIYLGVNSTVLLEGVVLRLWIFVWGNPFLKGFIDVACIFSLWWHFLAKNAAEFIPKNILVHSKGATLYYVLKELLCIFSQSGIKQSMATTPNANVIWERFSHHVLRIQHQKKRWWQRVMIFLLLFFYQAITMFETLVKFSLPEYSFQLTRAFVDAIDAAEVDAGNQQRPGQGGAWRLGRFELRWRGRGRRGCSSAGGATWIRALVRFSSDIIHHNPGCQSTDLRE